MKIRIIWKTYRGHSEQVGKWLANGECVRVTDIRIDHSQLADDGAGNGAGCGAGNRLATIVIGFNVQPPFTLCQRAGLRSKFAKGVGEGCLQRRCRIICNGGDVQRVQLFCSRWIGGRGAGLRIDVVQQRLCRSDQLCINAGILMCCANSRKRVRHSLHPVHDIGGIGIATNQRVIGRFQRRHIIRHLINTINQQQIAWRLIRLLNIDLEGLGCRFCSIYASTRQR